MLKFAFFSLLSILLSQGTFSAQETHLKPFVTCSLNNGQLGNQLFEIAATLAFAWDNNFEPLFPELKAPRFNLPMNHERIFFRLNASSLPRPIQHQFVQTDNFRKVEIPRISDQLLIGYFQTWEYFDHHRSKIREIFAPKPEELEAIKAKYAHLLAHPLTVAVHVRTFNKQWAELIPFVGLDYYERAMNLFPKEALFVVFSDRINWCKHHFQKFRDHKIIFAEGKDHLEEFFLMSLLKHTIIANSSYSWWAAYLNKNPEKIVIAPSHFAHPRLLSKTNANMPDWHVLDIDYDYKNAPYPEDITFYDERSKSIDTQ